MTIAVYCETQGDTPLELIGRAKQLDAKVTAIVEDREAQRFFAYGADCVIHIGVCEDDCAQGSVIVQALRQLNPDAALFPATVRGRFLSAWAAARLGTGLTADCTGLRLTGDGLLEQSRPAYGGNLTADILCRESRPQMASVRPGVFPLVQVISEHTSGTAGQFAPLHVRELLEKLDLLPMEKGVSLQTAQVIVAGGKGIGGSKGFEKLFELAQLMGGAVGATRGAVDAGWISYAHQIGQTGVIVRPRLYIGFAISGMIQHITGMNGSQTVVAVNRDRNAPIFSCADLGVVDDWETTANMMIKHFKERKGPR